MYNEFDGQKNLIFQSETFFSAYNSNGGMTVAQAATVLNWNPKHLDIKTRSVQPGIIWLSSRQSCSSKNPFLSFKFHSSKNVQYLLFFPKLKSFLGKVFTYCCCMVIGNVKWAWCQISY
jgi:hypothetical protein